MNIITDIYFLSNLFLKTYKALEMARLRERVILTNKFDSETLLGNLLAKKKRDKFNLNISYNGRVADLTKLKINIKMCREF